MIALVTGGGGFLGRYIVEKLIHRGDTVRSYGRGDYPVLRELGVEVMQGDIRDESAVQRACRGVDCVFHTAAVAGIWGKWAYYYGVNTAGTRHVVRACQKHSVPKLVYTSSPSVTFNGSDQQGVDESTDYATKWNCHYPQSKALAEQLVLASHGDQGLATCALRPHLIWGPRDAHLIPRLLKRARAGKLRRVGDGSNQIDMVYVDNAAAAHLQAADRLTLDSSVGGKPYFISQGEPVNCWEWINQLLALDNQGPIRRSVTKRQAMIIGGIMEATYWLLGREAEPPMTRFLAAQLASSHFFDISAAQRDFGYEVQVSTDQGMERLGSWLRDVNRHT